MKVKFKSLNKRCAMDNLFWCLVKEKKANLIEKMVANLFSLPETILTTPASSMD